MRYDAPEYVDRWRRTGVFPRIHEHIARLVRQTWSPDVGTLLDLGSSTGLLTRRLTDAGYRVAAVQAPGPALDLGQAAGVYDGIVVLPMRVTPATLPDLLDFADAQQARVVVARRVFPELHDALGVDGFARLAAGLRHGTGVHSIALEGRVVSCRSRHPLADADRECEALAPSWRVVQRRGACAVLARGDAKRIES